ncbi:hypothetical protein IAD21_06158 [Abditibacteriota bacterium]|nr:hypothetical protein IAD21_06158 [Abditibacteriota bacterium]
MAWHLTRIHACQNGEVASQWKRQETSLDGECANLFVVLEQGYQLSVRNGEAGNPSRLYRFAPSGFVLKA